MRFRIRVLRSCAGWRSEDIYLISPPERTWGHALLSPTDANTSGVDWLGELDKDDFIMLQRGAHRGRMRVASGRKMHYLQRWREFPVFHYIHHSRLSLPGSDRRDWGPSSSNACCGKILVENGYFLEWRTKAPVGGSVSLDLLCVSSGVKRYGWFVISKPYWKRKLSSMQVDRSEPFRCCRNVCQRNTVCHFVIVIVF